MSELSRDCCSEMARLVGSWIKDSQKFDKLYILKGRELRDNSRSHDVVAILQNTKITVIDPTVWQFFPDKNIFVGEFGCLEDAFSQLSKIYGGRWEFSEQMKNITERHMKEWKNLINKTLAENLTVPNKKE